MLFVGVGLLIGAILREVNKKIKLPYTPMLLVVGIIVGGNREWFGNFSEGTKIVERIDPHGILAIFIPTLLFESGYNCDYYVFKRNI